MDAHKINMFSFSFPPTKCILSFCLLYIACKLFGLAAYHGSKWNGSGGMVVDSNEVDEEGSTTDGGGEQRSTDHHLFDPNLPWNNHNITT